MPYDVTEEPRKELQAEINAERAERERLEAKYGQVWNTEELGRDFVVESFLAPFVGVVRKSDNKQGSLMFQHSPRYYFSFQPTG